MRKPDVNTRATLSRISVVPRMQRLPPPRISAQSHAAKISFRKSLANILSGRPILGKMPFVFRLSLYLLRLPFLFRLSVVSFKMIELSLLFLIWKTCFSSCSLANEPLYPKRAFWIEAEVFGCMPKRCAWSSVVGSEIIFGIKIPGNKLFFFILLPVHPVELCCIRDIDLIYASAVVSLSLLVTRYFRQIKWCSNFEVFRRDGDSATEQK